MLPTCSKPMAQDDHSDPHPEPQFSHAYSIHSVKPTTCLLLAPMSENS